ncbi:hypothetical protein BWI97_15680 [Siphonobacter sp. BAB-5405]|uniref:hypothetical protein n=1 Tax=Siphonobacter sp. BAB-5405 TaxID=1864825 RepID=UPI000C80D409|nr:hypothetical protein [Siphonobacter sp. BAB-5405]PMD94836.1 hypothetical protein BWI97_15680 [Siphonobacter sp. BAB-5405]
MGFILSLIEDFDTLREGFRRKVNQLIKKAIVDLVLDQEGKVILHTQDGSTLQLNLAEQYPRRSEIQDLLDGTGKIIPSQDNQRETTLPVVSDGQPALENGLAGTSTGPVRVFLNSKRIWLDVGNATKDADAYFSFDGGLTALPNSNVPAGAELFFNPTKAGFPLTDQDKITLDYSLEVIQQRTETGQAAIQSLDPDHEVIMAEEPGQLEYNIDLQGGKILFIIYYNYFPEGQLPKPLVKTQYDYQNGLLTLKNLGFDINEGDAVIVYFVKQGTGLFLPFETREVADRVEWKYVHEGFSAWRLLFTKSSMGSLQMVSTQSQFDSAASGPLPKLIDFKANGLFRYSPGLPLEKVLTYTK